MTARRFTYAQLAEFMREVGTELTAIDAHRFASGKLDEHTLKTHNAMVNEIHDRFEHAAQVKGADAK